MSWTVLRRDNGNRGRPTRRPYLWSPLVSGEQTNGQYSLMEQLMPTAAGPPPHVHDHGDEVFYIRDGLDALTTKN
jgi:mannose-6-phosphate isomerase-like protein (cupin superfamily)